MNLKKCNQFFLFLAIPAIALFSCEKNLDPIVGVNGDIGAVLDSCIIELYPTRFLRGVSVNDDGVVNGNDLVLFHLGTTSKMFVYWDDVNRGYVIQPYVFFEEHNSNKLGRVWDVEGQSISSGAQLHVWERHISTASKSKSQNWTFIRNVDGTYYIKNVRSELYVSLDNTNSDKDGTRLKQSSTPFKWDLAVLLGKNDQYEYSSYRGGLNWMSWIPDAIPLSQITIPGTHDCATTSINNWAFDPHLSMAHTQKLYIDEQLALGVRFFDLRLGAPFFGLIDDPGVYHTYVCLSRNWDYMHLSDVMTNFRNFLNTYTKETLIVLVSNVGNSNNNKIITAAIEKYIVSDSTMFWKGDTVPHLGDVRGKIVMLRRYPIVGNTKSADWFGLDLSAWGDYNNQFFTAKQAVKIYDRDSVGVWVQDYYGTNATTKISYVKNTLNQAASVVNAKTYLINYTSCTQSNPFSAARSMNSKLYDDIHFTNPSTESLGIIVMDFMDAVWARRIYEKN